MNLQIGILDSTFGWEIVLRQIGVSFQQVHPETSLADFACLIVNQAVSEDAKQRITDYLNEGGVLITNTAACLNLFSAHSKKIKIKYVQSQPDSLFAEIGLIDFYHNFKILKDCEFSFLDSSLFLQTKKQGKGRVINLPFDLDELVLNRDSLRKKFPAFRKELPSEIVAKVSKGKIRKLIETVLKFAFEERRLP
ncbi:MAG TPA: hypothetical protein PLD62_08960, partial [Candidatus Cloacimonadota bacterium]|nr:hypothetical protein [Candidatus Cloacimonadota bacterium]